MASATRATRVMLPNAVTKSLHVNSRCSLLFSGLHRLVLESGAVISGSESFFAGMCHSSGLSGVLTSHYAVQAQLRQQFQPRRARTTGRSDASNASSLNARGNSIIVGFLLQRKCALCAYRRTAENDVKKKIRAIQYGIGPIGASIAKLMREKQSVEIIGAIDHDPAKVGRDLGEVVGASDAPWGVKVSADAAEVLGQAADVVMHTTSSSLPKVMDQLLACLEAESCVVSTCEELSYPYRTHPELSTKLDTAAKEWGVALVGTGVNPGFVMDKLAITLGAVSQRIEHAKALRIVD